jgi:hypothetical protein
MKHSNNMREKITPKDNAGAVAKKAAEEKRVTARLDNSSDRIEIGTGAAHAGMGGNQKVGPVERMAPSSAPKNAEKEGAVEEEETGPKKARSKSSWIKGSSESKKMGGSHNVKGKL